MGFQGWVKNALLELGDHVAEVPGAAANPRIVWYDSFTTLKATSDEVPWCSAFVCAMMETAGIESTKKANARSWLQWGEELGAPQSGCVVVLSRPPSPQDGHVGFWMGERNGYAYVLAGNQGDAVSIARFPVSRVVGYRWPNGFIALKEGVK